MPEVLRRNVIVDCDPGVDDVLALLILLADPSIRILAITTSMGNCSADRGFSNATKLFVNLDRIMLMKGATEPRGGEKIDAGYFHGLDGLSDIEKNQPHLSPRDGEVEALYERGVLARPPPDTCAPSLIHSLLAQHPPRSVGLLTLGPATTLAASLAHDRHAFLSRCGLIVSMGGAIDVSGNTTAVAEFNVRADSYALHECLRGGLGDATNSDFSPRWLLLPLDVTVRHNLTFTDIQHKLDRFYGQERPANAPSEPLVEFLSPILAKLQKVYEDFGLSAAELHDPLAAWCMTSLLGAEDDGGWETESRLFDVERTGELTTGMLVVDRRSSAKTEKGRPRFDQKDKQPAPGRVPATQGPPPVQLKPIEVEVVIETPGIEKMREVLLHSWGPLNAHVPVRR